MQFQVLCFLTILRLNLNLELERKDDFGSKEAV